VLAGEEGADGSDVAAEGLFDVVGRGGRLIIA
jgi:hypothetical protein